VTFDEGLEALKKAKDAGYTPPIESYSAYWLIESLPSISVGVSESQPLIISCPLRRADCS
jgi:hypothetical protein